MSTQARLDEAASNFMEEDLKTSKQSIIEPDSDRPAGYKIEIQFGPDRTPVGPNVCAIQIWESGTKLNGGGDDKMYWCQDVRPDSKLGCLSPIPTGAIMGGMAYCPNCKAAINSRYLTGERFVKLTTKNLAKLVESLFISLKMNADIYCKYHPTDIRYIAMQKRYGLEKARRLRGLFIYPLKNIIKDTANGASLTSRFEAFLSA